MQLKSCTRDEMPRLHFVAVVRKKIPRSGDEGSMSIQGMGLGRAPLPAPTHETHRAEACGEQWKCGGKGDF